MSQRRKVTLGQMDMDALEMSCAKRGRKVVRGGQVDLYYNHETCDLVVDGRVGFTKDLDGNINAIYDNMYADQYATVMADYIEDLGEINGYSSYKVVARTESKDFVTVKIER